MKGSGNSVTPACISAWQFKHRRMHFFSSSWILLQDIDNPANVKSLLFGSRWWKDRADTHLLYPHTLQLPPSNVTPRLLVFCLQVTTALATDLRRLVSLLPRVRSFVLCSPNGEQVKQNFRLFKFLSFPFTNATNGNWLWHFLHVFGMFSV
jgi:hypothetical protein